MKWKKKDNKEKKITIYLGNGKLPLCVVNNCCIRGSRTFKEIFTFGSDATFCSAHPLLDHGFSVWIVQYGNSTCSS